MNNEWQMTRWINIWELKNEENDWDEVSTNLVNLNVHFPISAIVVLKIKHVEECTTILGVLCSHKYIRESPVQTVRVQRSSKHLKNIVKPSADSDGMATWCQFLSSFFSQLWRSRISTCLWTLLIQYTVQCTLLITGTNICCKKCLAIKNDLQMNCKKCLSYKKWLTREARIRSLASHAYVLQ
jgi:hypothetical protein